jgi:hypothetical protein
MMNGEATVPESDIHEILEKVRDVLAEMLHVDRNSIRADSALQEELGIDSFYRGGAVVRTGGSLPDRDTR